MGLKRKCLFIFAKVRNFTKINTFIAKKIIFSSCHEHYLLSYTYMCENFWGNCYFRENFRKAKYFHERFREHKNLCEIYQNLMSSKCFHKNGFFVFNVANKFCLFCNNFFRKSHKLSIFAKIIVSLLTSLACCLGGAQTVRLPAD